MTDTTAATWLRAFATAVLDAEDRLTALDQAAGDGDFGANIAGAVRFTLADLDALAAGAAEDEVISAAASAFLDRVGGTSGPLFGLLFQEFAAATRQAGGFTTAALAAGASAGLAAIQRVGEAEVGDKTLVDALSPAADALSALPDDTPLAEAFAAAARAADEGARSTADVRARRGRASYVGDHAIGVVDPGAVTVGLLFAAGT
ncbi:dihydroxyacetone kinase subunit DhaL [Actinokineospora bangkokensis]|uniref:Dihydroxyacetone kinase subunit L n=1 Tax=Actinokineospora bangkokensis TaxID=1193682 RepID=A0A1Q9LBQ4_9PSEU|nr:dihydroxyacetone kinase subunit DhaL [Actinokineospora bangkokensis]OLR89461.1 dihydroxyacetone kinase subunit L [Actinokineospora bangkokensis]